MRSLSVLPDLSSASLRVSDTVSTANFSATNCLVVSMPGMSVLPTAQARSSLRQKPFRLNYSSNEIFPERLVCLLHGLLARQADVFQQSVIEIKQYTPLPHFFELDPHRRRFARSSTAPYCSQILQRRDPRHAGSGPRAYVMVVIRLHVLLPQEMSHLLEGVRQHLAADSWPGGCR